MNKTFHRENLAGINVLITGGAGFIGSHIADYLIEHGVAKVRIVDNLSTGKYANIQHHEHHPAFEFINADLKDFSVCLDVSKNIDVVFHQAALGSVPRSIEHPLNTNENNVSGHLNMLWACVQNKVSRVVYASSSSVYGDDTHVPKTEESIGMPLSPYAVSKRVNEMYAHIFSSLYGLKIIGLRYFNVFGPRQDPKGPYAAVIPLFIDALLSDSNPVIFGSGEQSRDFTYVANIVQANILSAFTQNQTAFGSILNVGAGASTTVNELFQIIATAIGSDLKPNYMPERKGDIFRSFASVEKASETLGYVPLIQVREGIQKTIEYFKSAIE